MPPKGAPLRSTLRASATLIGTRSTATASSTHCGRSTDRPLPGGRAAGWRTSGPPPGFARLRRRRRDLTSSDVVARDRAYSGDMSSAAVDRTEEWAALRERYLRARDDRPGSTARGVHHVALLCADV